MEAGDPSLTYSSLVTVLAMASFTISGTSVSWERRVDLFGLPIGQSAPTVGQWVQLAGTYDSSTGKASLYVNGELIGTETSGGEIRIDQESLERPLVIGAEINGSNIREVANGFNGYVDEVRIYDRALSDDEIRALASCSQRSTPRSSLDSTHSHRRFAHPRRIWWRSLPRRLFGRLCCRFLF